ncbi:MAG: ATP-dependent zinc metalloprotease FtsH [Betaproteobacteria bacterium]|nr:ATP-dependent zinc metalloprotease FtsH [Betaproteobacteria bacterium]
MAEPSTEGPRAGPGSPGKWSFVWWLVAAVLAMAYVQYLAQEGAAPDISYTAFKQDVAQDQVASIVLTGHRVDGVFRAPAGKKPTRFATVIPAIPDAGLMGLLEQHHVAISAQPPRHWGLGELLLGLLPWMALGLLFYWGMRRLRDGMPGAGGGLFSFGKSRAKRFEKGTTSVTFADVAGLDEAKQDLREVIGYLKEPERYQALGAKIPRGLLLMGPPGTGKTLLAKAVAGEAEVPFFSISGSEFIEMFVGVGAARVRDMFESAKREAPAVIFIDEIDSVGRARGTGLGGGHDEREQTLNQILSEMDGFAPHEAVVVLAATNRPDVLDSALLRPGRFDRKLTLDLPEKAARQKILAVHTRHVPLAPDVDLAAMAARTVGFSGAELENLVNEGALLAARDRRSTVDGASFEKARDKILLGAPRESIRNEEEKRIVAYHEAGHALLASLLPGTDPLEKVTIIPRGRSLGATEQTPEEERHNLRRSYLLSRLGVMLGGRIAERLVFGEVSSGAEEDLVQATQLAQRMVARWGMSERLGAAAFRHAEAHVFLGRDVAQPRDFSEHTARLIDDEVRSLLAGVEDHAVRLLGAHRGALDAVAGGLLERETLSAEEVRRTLSAEPANTLEAAR